MATTFQPTFAGDFLRLRDELRQALDALAVLAGESLATFAHVARLQALSHALRAPLRLVAVGEKQVGKSTLLLALSGQETHDERSWDFSLLEVRSSEPWPEPAATEIDFLFFVFSITEPWVPSVWQRLKQLSPPTLDKSAIILQQTDLRDDREVQAVCDHLRQTVTRQLGLTLSVFPVAAKPAWLARTSGLDKPRLWAESHFDPLEKHLNERLAATDSAGGELWQISLAGQSILAEIVAQVQADKRVAAADRQQLDRLRAAADRFRQQAEAQEPAFRHDIDEAAARGQEQGEHLLNQRLRGGSAMQHAFGRNDGWQKDLHRNVSSIMRAAAVKQIEGALRILENELNAAWEQFDAAQDSLGPESQRHLVLDAATFEGSCAHLVEEIELAVVERMADDRAESQLHKVVMRLSRSLRWMWCFVGLSMATALAGACLSHPLAAILAWRAAALAWLIGWRVAARGRGEALEIYRELMRAKREELAREVGLPIRAAIQDFYLKLNDLLNPLEDSCRAQEARFQPLLARVHELDERFRDVAARL